MDPLAPAALDLYGFLRDLAEQVPAFAPLVPESLVFRIRRTVRYHLSFLSSAFLDQTSLWTGLPLFSLFLYVSTGYDYHQSPGFANPGAEKSR